MALMQIRQFKRLIKSGEQPGNIVLRKPLISVIEALDNRLVRYTISTASEDRERDTIALDGWDTRAFEQNPVVLWGHKASDLPIGRCVELIKSDSALKAVVDFVPADMPSVGDKAEAVLRMSRTGFLSATSVGFRPLEYEIAKDRDDEDSWWPPFNFLKQELLEFSIVSIPANPEALIDPAERATQLDAEVLNAIQQQVAATVASALEAEKALAAVQRRRAQLRAYD